MVSYNRDKRMAKEWSSMLKAPTSFLSYGPFADGWEHVKGTLNGPENSVYEGGVFILDIKIPKDYPFRVPKMKFDTKIYHPNISSAGLISIDVLDSKWTPALTIQKVMEQIYFMLPDPNPDDPLEPEVARIYKTDRQLYNKTARQWTEQYAR